MDPARLRQRLKNGEPMIGLSVNYPAAGILETIGRMWDFVWLDGQHGQISQDAMLSMVRTADLVGIDSVVRVPGSEGGIVGPYADMMPSALMIPMVDTPADAAAVVQATRFPPLGSRSFGGRRPIDIWTREYFHDKEPVVVAQIETPAAMENVDAIAATEGIDVLMLGPDDFKTRLGLPIDAPLLETPALADALRRVAEAALGAGKAAACIAPTAETIRYAMSLGYRLLVGTSDVGLLREGSRLRADLLRKAIVSENG